MIPLIGLIVGILIGSFLNIDIPTAFMSYMPVAILAALDSIFGGVRAALEKKFNSDIFVSGFFGNIIIAAVLTYLGDKLNVPMYLAAVFVFGGRIFNNFAYIRRIIFGRKKDLVVEHGESKEDEKYED
ncbi:small basic family protein [Clostridium cylindrosporum]|uniref:Small basic protein n=1 Tax=Clostridium cylindrosporum DSM 605 TaxID=1121307 RepID=A0A0J8DAR7_CLOCY|nr:small basic family protein [Clostridium cylindrosporum]KMT21409.1 small basic protein [Clostridium cylindrosporum DSM 605]